MPTQQEEMRERFRKIGDGSVRFIATRDEVLDFLQSEISLAVAQREKEIVEMIEEKKLKEPLYIGETQYRFYKGNVDWVYNSALNDIINTLKGGKE